MKIKTSIEEITRDDLVNLLSTALYGSSYLEADYTNSSLKEKDDCFEDILARNLLAGDSIVVTDWYAEGTVYGNLQHIIDDEDECVHYTLNLDDIKNGLAKAADGTFNVRADVSEDFASGNRECALASFNAFYFNEKQWDMCAADTLMQIILFNEIIYG